MLNNQPGSAQQQQVSIDLSRIGSVKLPLASWNSVLAGLWELPGKVGLPLIRELEQQLAPVVQQARRPSAPADGLQNSLNNSEALTDE